MNLARPRSIFSNHNARTPIGMKRKTNDRHRNNCPSIQSRAAPLAAQAAVGDGDQFRIIDDHPAPLRGLNRSIRLAKFMAASRPHCTAAPRFGSRWGRSAPAPPEFLTVDLQGLRLRSRKRARVGWIDLLLQVVEDRRARFSPVRFSAPSRVSCLEPMWAAASPAETRLMASDSELKASAIASMHRN
jgi:hypothetical protein